MTGNEGVRTRILGSLRSVEGKGIVRVARWSSGRRVVVLGAGARRGAEFVVAPPSGVAAPKCLPPLNADLFTQLQRITTDRHEETLRAVIHDVVTIYRPNSSLTLEQYFTQLEAMVATVRAPTSSYWAPRIFSMKASSVVEDGSDPRPWNEAGNGIPGDERERS